MAAAVIDQAPFLLLRLLLLFQLVIPIIALPAARLCPARTGYTKSVWSLLGTSWTDKTCKHLDCGSFPPSRCMILNTHHRLSCTNHNFFGHCHSDGTIAAVVALGPKNASRHGLYREAQAAFAAQILRSPAPGLLAGFEVPGAAR